MFALIAAGTVAQVAPDAFPVAPPLSWVDCTAAPGVAPGWTYDGTAFQMPPAPAPAAPPVQISPLQFMARFTAAETAGIAAAALSSSALFLWFMQASAASYIDLTDPRTKAGLDALVAAGLLTADRQTAVLTP